MDQGLHRTPDLEQITTKETQISIKLPTLRRSSIHFNKNMNNKFLSLDLSGFHIKDKDLWTYKIP